MEIDIISWLRETGGNNAIKRFSKEKKPIEASQSPQSDKVTLSKEEAASMRMGLRYNQAGQLLNFSTNTGLSGIFQDLMEQRSSLARMESENRYGPPEKSGSQPESGAALSPFDRLNVTGGSKQAAEASGTDQAGNTTELNGRLNFVKFRDERGLVERNEVVITGDRNYVNGVNGGQKDNTVTIEGDSNNILMSGRNVSNGISISGGNNDVQFGEGSANNTVNIDASNVKVFVGSDVSSPGTNSGYNIDVQTDNIGVIIINGRVSVAVPDERRDSISVDVNDETKSIRIYEKAAEAAGEAEGGGTV